MNTYEKIFRSYLKNHSGNFFVDDEEGKIKQTKMQIAKSIKENRKQNKKIKTDEDNEDKTNEEISLKKLRDKRLRSNTHKKRLKELEKNEEFN
jgi:hypothetical protein